MKVGEEHMVVLTKRQKDILHLLCLHEDYITFDSIAKKLSVSNRTIRNDIQQIEFFLLENDIELVRKSGVGVYLNCDEVKKGNLKKEAETIHIRSFSKKERISLIKMCLLLNPICTYQEIADVCLVCKQTIINGFDEIITEIKAENVIVEKIQGVGIQLQGNEIDVRRMFIQLLNENSCPEEINELIDTNQNIHEFKEVVDVMFQQLESEHDVSFKDISRIKRIISYVLSRIKKGNTISEDFVFPQFPIHDSLDMFFNFLEPYIRSDKERMYLSTIMVSERMSQLSDFNPDSKIDDEAHQIAMFLVDSLQSLQPLQKEYVQEMIDGLTLHLRTAIHRCRNNLKVKNELVDQTKMTISLIYEFTRKQLYQVGQQYGIEFDENEIAYIAMYIASIYEIGFQDMNTVNVLLVCSFGLATSSILKSRLSKFLPEVTIIGPVSETQSNQYLKNNEVDLIISTSEYTHPKIPVITVNALLNHNDIERIKNRLYEFSYAKTCTSFINTVASSEEESGEIHFLKDYVPIEHIQIVDSIGSWENAIQLAAKPLLDKKLIEQNYVDTMIHAVNEYGTYMVMTPNTAYVHAGVDDGIYENCTSVLILKNPIMFGYVNPKMVRAIVVLGVKNKQENDLLNIAYIFEKEWNIKTLEEKDISKQEIINMHD